MAMDGNDHGRCIVVASRLWSSYVNVTSSSLSLQLCAIYLLDFGYHIMFVISRRSRRCLLRALLLYFELMIDQSTNKEAERCASMKIFVVDDH
jgi:hypothetical protein